MAEDNLFSANTPSGLDEGETIATLNHAFRTKLLEDGEWDSDLAKEGFGFRGANAGVAVRSRIWDGLEIRAYTASKLSEYGGGLSYTYDASQLKVLAGAEGFFLLEGEKFRKGSYSFVTISTEAASSYLILPSLGLGYDYYNDLAAVTLGISVPFTDEHALVGEYHPRLNQNSRNLDVGEYDTWNVGYRWTSGKHQFSLHLSNSSAVNEREANLGSDSSDPNWAFRVTRLL